MSISEKYPDYLSQSASEIPSGEDIEAMIARLDQKWRELKKLLRAEEGSPYEEELAPPVVPVGFNPGEIAYTVDSCWSSLLAPPKGHVNMTAQEAEAIVERVEKLDEEADLQEQLVKIQWQNRGLIVYSVICTVMFLYLFVSIFFSNDSYAISQNRKNPAKEVHLAADPKAPIPDAVSIPLTAVAATAGETLSSLPGTGSAPTSPQAALTTAVGQNQVSSTGETPTPPMEYMGSVTSNKYHYRSCKWAKFINPSKERLFHSVAEARKAGYINCPTCQPPLTDEIKTSKR